jgi:hypothetical protein
MRRQWARVLLLAAVLAVLPGCRSAQVYATREAAIHEAKPPRIIAFEAGEKPVIVVDLPKHCLWGQKVGSVWVEEAVSGRAVWHQSQFMRQGSKYYFIPEGLERGTYLVVLRAEGEPVAVTNFDVR